MGAEKTQTFVKQNWSATDPDVQNWVNQVVWQIFSNAETISPIPNIEGSTEYTFEVCRRVLLYNQLHGMSRTVFGEPLTKLLGESFEQTIDADRKKNQIYQHELHTILNFDLGARTVVLGDALIRPRYSFLGDDVQNPRFIGALKFWVPTLETREAMMKALEKIGYLRDVKADTYLYYRVTAGFRHYVELVGTLWPSSKSWSTDIERTIWDRAVEDTASDIRKFNATDLLLLCIRTFSVDSLLGSGVALLDIMTLLDRAKDTIDWERLRSVKNMFAKPDWLWSAFLAVTIAEKKCGRKFDLPNWVKTELQELKGSFWEIFITSRLNWACPDSRIIDFSRAQAKLVKGL